MDGSDSRLFKLIACIQRTRVKCTSSRDMCLKKNTVSELFSVNSLIGFNRVSDQYDVESTHDKATRWYGPRHFDQRHIHAAS
jgi:hypothetical protein